jgi:signal transduction histidine kinase
MVSPPEGFIVDIQEDLPDVYMPREAVRKVFHNLVDNAFKHHDGVAGHVEVRGQENGDLVEFAVRDDGPGIAPRFHNKVFQIFQTLRRRDEAETGGMGLAIVKKTVETYGGSIELESDGARGATFRFTLPEREMKSLIPNH